MFVKASDAQRALRRFRAQPWSSLLASSGKPFPNATIALGRPPRASRQNVATPQIEHPVLTPELKQFIDRAIVPTLVDQYLAETERGLAKKDSDAANSVRTTAKPRKPRP